MSKRTFLNCEKPLLVCMVQADNPARIKELIDRSLPEGAEAFGMQFCKMKEEYRNESTYRELFAYTDKPIYVTNYRRHGENANRSDEEIAACKVQMEHFRTAIEKIGPKVRKELSQYSRNKEV